MKLVLSTFLGGLIFGIGLTIAQMVNPFKVISFLDIFGNWDPSLAFVMGTATLTTFIGYRFVLNRKTPLLANRFRLPTKTDIDFPLIFGSTLFGIGWGMVGLCPGPAVASLSFVGLNSVIFVAAMVAGMVGYRIFMPPR